jgi:PKD repeat protein
VTFTASTFGYDFTCGTHGFSWDFGDGTTPGSGRSTTHTYVSTGAWNLKLTITVNGQQYVVPQTVKVVGQSPGGPVPEYAFGFLIDQIAANTYKFTAFSKGSAIATTYNWNFGDGNTASGPSPIQIHQYMDSNNYTVTLSVPGVPGSVQQQLVSAASRRRPARH